MSEFWSMGGYGWFLWPAYAVTFLALIANVIIARRAHQLALRELERRLQINDEGDES
jgi:heme exporter protein D